MARMGLNCTLSYTDPSGMIRKYQIRAGNISFGVQMISSESAARTQRAYYPHKTAMQQFTVQALLKNWDERTSFVNWLSSYSEFSLDPDTVQPAFPWMKVEIPLRGFTQYGVPLEGYEWGAHTGMMMFTPDIVFESVKSPGQQNYPQVSSVINKWSAFSADTAIQYFYPFGVQLSGNQQGSYAQIQYPGDPTQFTNPTSTPPQGVGGGAPAPGGGAPIPVGPPPQQGF
jgi:hypothetical protein